MQSTHLKNFGLIPTVDTPRSSFNLSHRHSTTFDSGLLIPIMTDIDIYPGDTISLNVKGLVRLLTPTVPIFDNIYIHYYVFACPHRILWTNFKKQMGEQDDPGDSVDYTTPMVYASSTDSYTYQEGELADYFCIPTEVAGSQNSDMYVCAYPFRMYNKLWNEFFRSQDLQDSVDEIVSDGPNSVGSNYQILPVGKMHDYFTSCLPDPQKGDDILIPITGTAPITGLGTTNQSFSHNSTASYETDGTGITSYNAAVIVDQVGGINDWLSIEEDPNNAGYPNVRADFTNAALEATISDLRLAAAMQRVLEVDQRGGTRYPELILSHFGVTNPDHRMMRVEYLGGGRQVIGINPIVQQSQTDTTPQGTLAATGTGVINGQRITKSFTEHCTLMVLVAAKADQTYQHGLERQWSRAEKFDYMWPTLANISEQAVLLKELYSQFDESGADNDNSVFGYQERFAELRSKPSHVSGKFRSNATGSLDIWHLAEELGSQPSLDDTFISTAPPIDRIVAVEDEPEFKANFYFDYKVARCLPTYGRPGFGGRF